MTRAEVLHGARGAASALQLTAALDGFQQISIGDDLWDVIGRNLMLLRSSGLTLPFPDVVIATVAVESNLPLWTRDAQFQLIQRTIPALQLFQEPP